MGAISSNPSTKIPVWGIVLLIIFAILVIGAPVLIHQLTERRHECKNNNQTHVADGDSHYIKLDHTSCPHNDILSTHSLSHSPSGGGDSEVDHRLYRTERTVAKTRKRYATVQQESVTIQERTELGKDVPIEILLSEHLIAITFEEGLSIVDEHLHSVEIEVDTLQRPELKEMFGTTEGGQDVGTVAGYWKLDGTNHEVQIQVDHVLHKVVLQVSVSSNSVHYLLSTQNELHVVRGAQFIYRK